MKQLKSSLRDLREVFERGITVKDIAEPFVSFDGDRDATMVRQFLEQRDFDVVGVRRDGVTIGYALRDELAGGSLTKYTQAFPNAEILPATGSLLRAFEALLESTRVFVDTLGHIGGIITRGDLQKAPIRMWLFGVIQLVEMQMLRVIRDIHAQTSRQLHLDADLGEVDSDSLLRNQLSPGRLQKAEEILRDRKRRNEASDLADCIQFGDKAKILMTNEKIRAALGFQSRGAADEFFGDLQDLRNNLAHAQDIVSGDRQNVVGVIRRAEDVLLRLEEVEVSDAKA